jgi:outer membrane protein
LKKNRVLFSALLLGVAAQAGAQDQAQAQPPAAPTAAKPAVSAPAAIPTKVAIINVQLAILNTADGKKATADITAKFTPRRSLLEKQQADLQTQNDQLRKGAATMSAEAKEKLQKDFEANQKRFQRDTEDFDADIQQEENRFMNDLGQKMMEIIIKYCQQNGYAMVVNVGDQQANPVLWADPAIEITADIIKLYDQAHPPQVDTAKPSGAVKPPAGSAVKPSATPQTKK